MSKRQVLAAKTKQERKAARVDLGELKNLIIKPSTETRYKNACLMFFEWLVLGCWVFPKCPVALDEKLGAFISDLWQEGEAKSTASNLLAGMQHYSPTLKRRLPISWRLISAWQKTELPCRAPPLTWELVKAFCGRALALLRPDVAAAILIAFHCLLRTGEMLKLTAGSFAFASNYNSGVINLGKTKVGQRLGINESVTIEEPLVCKFIAARCLSLAPGDLLLPKGQTDFRTIFAKIGKELLLEEFNFKPYSLRRGGATHHFRTNNMLSKTIVRGRWNNAKSARVYINDGLATLASFRHTQDAVQPMIALFEKRCQSVRTLACQDKSVSCLCVACGALCLTLSFYLTLSFDVVF
jgi:hypothetical protein